ncbi:hypothetical protein P8452_66444 [Trifolium repens]|nr:hypothetical protein P8452_66444 [Trifolium repens]
MWPEKSRLTITPPWDVAEEITSPCTLAGEITTPSNCPEKTMTLPWNVSCESASFRAEIVRLRAENASCSVR